MRVGLFVPCHVDQLWPEVGFAALALVLAAVGVYGLISYSTSRRAREFGVRLALGASARQIVVAAMGDGVKYAAIGVGVGLAAAYALTRSLSTMLFDISATDPLTFGSLAIVMLIVAGLGVALASPWPLLGALGFGILGVGAANVVPVLFSRAARTPGVEANVGVAAVATFGYSGFLVTPPVLGLVADGFGLSASLGVVLLMGLVIAGLGTVRR